MLYVTSVLDVFITTVTTCTKTTNRRSCVTCYQKSHWHTFCRETNWLRFRQVKREIERENSPEVLFSLLLSDKCRIAELLYYSNSARLLQGRCERYVTPINPCSPEGFSQTYFPKGGVVATPPLDYQYWRSYNPKFTTSV